jgi:hypothetical protein
MFEFDNLPEQQEFKKRKFIRPGVQNLILKDITLQVSPNTHNERPVFSMETEPVTDEGFEPHEDANYGGQIGNISGNFGYYLKTDNQKLEFIVNLRDIMKAVGTYEAFMEKHGKTNFQNLQEVIDAAKPYLVGTKACYFVAAEQYQKLNNTGIGLKLKFPSRKMVEAVGNESKLAKFDETNPNHFKKLQKTTTTSTAPVDDLPF